MENIQNLKIMSIGGNCVGINCLGHHRQKGPVDNIIFTRGLSSIKVLFENTLLNDIKKVIPKQTPRSKDRKDDPPCSFNYDLFSILHNNPLEEKYLVEITKRYNSFLDFYGHIKNNDPNYLFCYSITLFDVDSNLNVTNNFIQGVSLLKKYNIFNKTIFIETNPNKPFWQNCYSDSIKEYNPKTIRIDDFDMRSPELRYLETLETFLRKL